MGKNFKGGLDSLLSGSGKRQPKGSQQDQGEKPKRGRPRTNFKTVTRSSQLGTKPDETRATFIVNEEQLDCIKAMAYWERISIKDVLSQAIDAYLKAQKQTLPKALEIYRAKKPV